MTSCDIVERITSWADATPDAVTSRLLREAATEINVQRACTSAGRDEIARLRLTDEEREALAAVLKHYEDVYDEHGASVEDDASLATLRGLLERSK